eukprot:2909094-Amphidinium_carterae.1
MSKGNAESALKKTRLDVTLLCCTLIFVATLHCHSERIKNAAVLVIRSWSLVPGHHVLRD